VLITETRPPVSYYTTLPPPPGIMRRSDVARLKELRRRLDSGQCTLEEINQITVELMGECAEVSLPQDQQDMTDDSSHPIILGTR
jgi:protein JSN1